HARTIACGSVRRAACERGPRPGPLRGDRNRDRPRVAHAGPGEERDDPQGRLRSRCPRRGQRPCRERPEAVPAAHDRRAAPRAGARRDDRHDQGDAMTQTTTSVIQVANYIDGGWSRAASGATLESRDPATGDLVAIAPQSSAEDVGRAIAAARAAFDDGAWPATSGRERAAILFDLARLLREEMEPLSRLVATELG